MLLTLLSVASIGTSGAALLYSFFTTRKPTPQPEPANRQGAENTNIQGSNNHVQHTHVSNELLYFAQAKDLQRTVDSLMSHMMHLEAQLMEKSMFVQEVIGEIKDVQTENKALRLEIKDVQTENKALQIKLAHRKLPMLPVNA
jgi:hypothetical protein